MSSIIIHNLGLISYGQALTIQENLFNTLIRTKQVGGKNVNNHLIFCEHPHVFTLGRNGIKNHLLMSHQELKVENIDFFNTSRGGDITYHGPGQLVCYAILDLDNFFNDIGKYVRSLEEIVICTLSDFGIKGQRLDKLTGVWIKHQTNYAKICAIGIKCSRWVTMHGIAFNINTDLSYFDKIIPCGIQDKGVTSLQQELKTPIDIQKIIKLIIKHFSNIFGVSDYTMAK